MLGLACFAEGVQVRLAGNLPVVARLEASKGLMFSLRRAKVSYQYSSTITSLLPTNYSKKTLVIMNMNIEKNLGPLTPERDTASQGYSLLKNQRLVKVMLGSSRDPSFSEKPSNSNL